jgi:hypothetical protein
MQLTFDHNIYKIKHRRTKTVDFAYTYISLRVSLVVLSPEIENLDEVEVSSWVKHTKTFYSE